MSSPRPSSTSSDRDRTDSDQTDSDQTDLDQTDLDQVARLRLAMVRLTRQQRRSYPTGLTPSQISVLITIDHHGPVRLTDLARLEAVAPPTITRIVAKLEADGLVARQVDANDRRIARVSMTDEGRRRTSETREARNGWMARKLTALSDEDNAAILAVVEPLERLVEAAPVEPAPDGAE